MPTAKEYQEELENLARYAKGFEEGLQRFAVSMATGVREEDTLRARVTELKSLVGSEFQHGLSIGHRNSIARDLLLKVRDRAINVDPFTLDEINLYLAQ